MSNDDTTTVHGKGFTASMKTSNAVYARAPINETDVSDLTGIEPFANQTERLNAIRDPRYQSDDVYRQWFNRRLWVTLKGQG